MALLLSNETVEISDSEQDDPTMLVEAIVDLYLTVKIRKEEDEINESLLNDEKEHLMNIDPFVVLEYIRNSFDILLNMKMEENKETGVFKFGHAKSSHGQSTKTATESQLCSEADNNDYE
jgi:hypothetical protein